MATSESMRSVSAWIDREDHLLLQSVLNIYSTTRQNALAIGEILMVGVKTFLEEREGDGELDAEARLRIMEWVTRKRLGNQATLNAIAARGPRVLSEEEAERLHEIAEELDLDEEKAAELALGTPYASVIAFSNNGTKGGQCQQWLASLLSEQQDGIARTYIVSMGSKLGYTESMINRASRVIGVAKRKETGGAWVWYPRAEDELSPVPDPF